MRMNKETFINYATEVISFSRTYLLKVDENIYVSSENSLKMI